MDNKESLHEIYMLLTAGERKEHLRRTKNTLLFDDPYESEHKHCDGYVSAVHFLQTPKNLPCLKTKHGELQTINKFSNHNMPIFATFSDNFDFVPQA